MRNWWKNLPHHYINWNENTWTLCISSPWGWTLRVGKWVISFSLSHSHALAQAHSVVCHNFPLSSTFRQNLLPTSPFLTVIMVKIKVQIFSTCVIHYILLTEDARTRKSLSMLAVLLLPVKPGSLRTFWKERREYSSEEKFMPHINNTWAL